MANTHTCESCGFKGPAILFRPFVVNKGTDDEVWFVFCQVCLKLNEKEW